MKKALVYFIEPTNNDFLKRETAEETPCSFEISDELAQKFRIMEELSTMSLEACPLINPKDPKYNGIPFSMWPVEVLQKSMPGGVDSKEYEDINVICERYEKEVHETLVDLINKSFNKEIKSEEVFLEYYLLTENDKLNSVAIVMLVRNEN